MKSVRLLHYFLRNIAKIRFFFETVEDLTVYYLNDKLNI